MGHDNKLKTEEKLNPDYMKDYYQLIVREMKERFDNINYIGDLSDLGNEIGIVIGKHIDSKFAGWGKDDFFHGIEHGINEI